MNYAKELPKDKTGAQYDSAPPAFTANATQIGVPVASSVITFNANTTVIRMGVMGGQSGNAAVWYKWGAASVTASNADGFVMSGDTRSLVIPKSVFGTVTSLAGANVQNGLYQNMAVITATAQSASVITAEY